MSGANAVVSQQRYNLDAFHKFKIKDLPPEYRKWLVEEVGWIITDEEREVFLRIDNDARRDLFIEEFWGHRDPTPGTPANEYKEEHYRRLNYVNRHFGRDTPRKGWQTDRGRTYILLGKPKINRHFSEMIVRPMELWSYQGNRRLGLPSFFNILFFRKEGVGEYKTYSPIMDGPYELLNPSGGLDVLHFAEKGSPNSDTSTVGAIYDVLQYVDTELADTSLNLIPGQIGQGLTGHISMVSDILLGEIQDLPRKIMPNAEYAYRVLVGSIEADVRYETLPLQVVASALLDPTGEPFIHYAFKAQGQRLNLRQHEDKYYLTFDISGSLTDSEHRVVKDIPAETLEASDLSAEEARQLRSEPLVYFDRITSIPGDYDLELVVENNVSHEFGRSSFHLRVPKPWPEKLYSSPLLLCTQFRLVDGYRPFLNAFPFQVGPLLLLPALVQEGFKPGDKVHLFHQIYFPHQDKRPVTITYRLERNGVAVIEKIVQRDASGADAYGTVNQVMSLDLADVPPGSYKLTVDLDADEDPPFSLKLEVKEPDPDARPPYAHPEAQPPVTDRKIALDRANQYRAVGDTEAAIATLRKVLTQEPGLQEALKLQTELLMEAGHYQELDGLLAPRLVDHPNDPDLLLTLAETNANLGNHYDAIRYYERARLAGLPDDPELLNTLAAEYFADGKVEKALQLLEQSLKMRPEQPAIRKLLERVTQQAEAKTR
ncbi:MAG: GWxTD domain-containing protein [Acidobacteriota bacterium]